MLDDRNDESPVERHGDADVVLLAVDEVGAGHRRVHDRERLEAVDDGFDDERHVGQLLAGVGLEAGPVLRAQACDAGEVELHERRHVRGSAARDDHVLGDALAHDRHGLDDVARPRLGGGPVLLDAARRVHRGRRGRATRDRGRGRGGGLRGARVDVVHDVALGDATGDAAPLHGGDLDPVLGGDLADERGGLGLDALLEGRAVAAGGGDGGCGRRMRRGRRGRRRFGFRGGPPSCRSARA